MTYRLQTNVSMSLTDYGSAILDTKAGRYFQLNPVATEMLQMVGNGEPKSQVVEAVVRAYDVERQRAQNDLETLIVEALRTGLIAERVE